MVNYFQFTFKFKKINSFNLFDQGSFQLQLRKLTEQALEDTKKQNPINYLQRALNLCRSVERNSFGISKYLCRNVFLNKIAYILQKCDNLRFLSEKVNK